MREDSSSDAGNNRRVVRRQFKHWLDQHVISRRTPGDKEVQQVRYPVLIRRPVGRFTIAEVGTVASTNSREESASFRRDKARASDGMLRIPVTSNQKPWSQGLGECCVGGKRLGLAWGTVDGRYCQRPWESFKVDSNSLQCVGLEAEVFVVT